MADYTDNAFLASIKALDKVVLPAVDANDPLAAEQLRLVSGFLKFLRTRMPHLDQRHFFELNHYLTLAEDVAADARLVGVEVAQRLDAALAQARAVQASARPDAAAVQAASAALAAPISALVRSVADAETALRQRVEQKVVAGSRRWVDAQRAWFAPQGFELHADELPALDAALATSSPASAAP